MNNKFKAALVAVFCVAVIAGAYFMYQFLTKDNAPGALPTPSAASTPKPSEEGAGLTEAGGETHETESQEETAVEAPDVTVYKEDGTAVKLSDYQGKPTVVLFWASWCSACKMEMPALQAAHENYGDQINFVGIDLCGYGGDDPAEAKAVIEGEGYTFDVLYDNDGEAMFAYSAYSIPVTCFINAEGELVQGYIGALNEEIITELALGLLDEA